MSPQNDDKSAPSNVDSKSTHMVDFFSLLSDEVLSGPRSLKGYIDQSGYALLRVIGWEKDRQFINLKLEGLEDVDVQYFDGEKVVFDFHQVKNYPLTPSEIEPYLDKFRKRKAKEPDYVRKLVLAAPPGTKGTDVEKLKLQLAAAKVAWHHPIPSVRSQTRADFTDFLSKLGTKLDGYVDDLLERVEFYDDFPSMNDVEKLVQQISNAIARVAAYRNVDRLTIERIASFMLGRFHLLQGKVWSRQDLFDEIDQALMWFSSDKKVVAPDAFIIRQLSLNRTKPFEAERTLIAAREALGQDDLLIRQASFKFRGKGDFPSSSSELRRNTIAILQQLSDPGGTLTEILNEYPDSQILLMGVIEIPFAVLTGYLIGSGRKVRYFEHDHDNPRFFWLDPKSAEIKHPLQWEPVDLQESLVEDAIIVGSFSRTVHPSAYQGIVSEPHIQLCFKLETPQRDTIESEEQLMKYLKEIRKKIELLIDKMPKLKRLHLFLSVPITLAYGIGKLFRPSDLPAEVRIYQYEGKRYVWGLSIMPDAEPFQPQLYSFIDVTSSQ